MYFLMETDNRIKNRFRFEEIESNVSYEFNEEDFDKIQDITVLFIEDNDSVYPDIIATPLLMVSERLKQVLEPYSDEIIYKAVFLNNPEKKIQKRYFLVLASKIDALSDKSEFYPNGWIKKAVLSKGKDRK